MSFFRTEYIKQNKIKVIACALALLFLAWAVFYFGESLKAIFTSSDAVRDWVLQYGKFAPLALFLLQVAQVIVAPLNNFLINFAGGYIFGPYMGFVYNYFGWILGAIIVFWLTRCFGRRFVDLFVSKDKLKKFDNVLSRGTYIIFLLLLLPGPPDDFLVYVIGLTRSIKFKTFLWMILIGKIPGKIATSFLGAGVAEQSSIAIGAYAVFIIASVVVFIKKPELWHIGRKS